MPAGNAEKAVAVLGELDRAHLQSLERASDRRDRCSQLVGGVGNELALRALAAFSLGHVGEHDDRDRRPSACRDAGDGVGAILLRIEAGLGNAGVGVEQASGEVSKFQLCATAPEAARLPRGERI